jgi:XRE family transcriptional regulator, aerobic/anaerobic benzoate catabolism transcriptional regulator
MSSTDIAVAVGAKVRAGRARIGLTRKQFAAKAGVSERYLNELESGAANASIAIIAKMAEALGLSPIDLMAASASSPDQPALRELRTLIGTATLPEQQALVPLVAAWLAERRRASKGIALLGLRGAGKSSLGKMLAARYGIPLVSVTNEIERRAGMGLNEIFNLGGPDSYRAMENDVIADLVARDGRIVLETAGGITGNSEMMTTILARFKTVWLKASPEEHLARVTRQGDTRPMRGNPTALEHLKVLLLAREPEYARADAVIDTSGRSIEDCFAELETIAASALQVYK